MRRRLDDGSAEVLMKVDEYAQARNRMLGTKTLPRPWTARPDAGGNAA